VASDLRPANPAIRRLAKRMGGDIRCLLFTKHGKHLNSGERAAKVLA
jgi:hypothetical protein